MEVRDNLWKSVPFFPCVGFQGPNSGDQSCWQATVPTESFCWPSDNSIRSNIQPQCFSSLEFLPQCSLLSCLKSRRCAASPPLSPGSQGCSSSLFFSCLFFQVWAWVKACIPWNFGLPYSFSKVPFPTRRLISNNTAFDPSLLHPSPLGNCSIHSLPARVFLLHLIQGPWASISVNS